MVLGICSRCVSRSRLLAGAHLRLESQWRPFTSQISQLQRPNILPEKPSESASKPPAPAVPVRASPSTDPAAPPSTGPSTAEMQRTISTSLSTPSLPASLANKLRKTAPNIADSYTTYAITQTLFTACSAQADYTIPEPQRLNPLTGKGPPKTPAGEDLGLPHPTPTSTSPSDASFWFTTLALPPTFSTWTAVTYLHLYLLLVRIRALSAPAITISRHQQFLLDHFSHAAEDKMILLHGLSVGGTRQKYLKDLFLQWRGVVVAYDQGLVEGDAVLGAAVWRNVFKGEREVEWERVAVVVAWMRRVVQGLGGVGDQELLGVLEEEGVFKKARAGVLEEARGKSRGMSERVGEEDGKA